MSEYGEGYHEGFDDGRRYAQEKIAALKAEIERKDDALRRIVDAFSPEIIHIGTMKTKYKAIYDVDSFDPIKQAKQALQNKEESKKERPGKGFPGPERQTEGWRMTGEKNSKRH